MHSGKFVLNFRQIAIIRNDGDANRGEVIALQHICKATPDLYPVLFTPFLYYAFLIQRIFTVRAYARAVLGVCLSVCLSVRPSVCHTRGL